MVKCVRFFAPLMMDMLDFPFSIGAINPTWCPINRLDLFYCNSIARKGSTFVIEKCEGLKKIAGKYAL